MESSIAVFLMRRSACELLPTTANPWRLPAAATALLLRANYAEGAPQRMLAPCCASRAGRRANNAMGQLDKCSVSFRNDEGETTPMSAERGQEIWADCATTHARVEEGFK